MDQAAHTAAVQPDRANDGGKNGQNIIIHLSRIRLFDLAEIVVGRSMVLSGNRNQKSYLHMLRPVRSIKRINISLIIDHIFV